MGITLLTIVITLLIREFSLLFGISFTWDVTEIVVKFASLLRNGLKYAAKKEKKKWCCNQPLYIVQIYTKWMHVKQNSSLDGIADLQPKLSMCQV